VFGTNGLVLDGRCIIGGFVYVEKEGENFIS